MPLAKFFLVDAFSDVAFGGNPAAVVLSSAELPLEQRKNVAKEFAQPAIAFVSHPSLPNQLDVASSEPLAISWFTSAGKQIAFCGHASMGASVVLMRHLHSNLDSVTFSYPKAATNADGKPEVIKAILRAEKVADGRIKIDAVAANEPIALSREEKAMAMAGMKTAMALSDDDFLDVHKSLAKDLVSWDLLAVLNPKVDLATLHPDFPLLGKLPYHGIWLTNRLLDPKPSASGAAEPFRSRVFFPSFGINEDWVCGTAHTLFGPYWATTAPAALTTISAGGSLVQLEAHQVSPRGGKLGMVWDGKWGEENGVCSLLGSGRVFAAGELFL